MPWGEGKRGEVASSDSAEAHTGLSTTPNLLLDYPLLLSYSKWNPHISAPEYWPYPNSWDLPSKLFLSPCTYLSTPGVPKSGDVSKSSRCKNAFYDNVRILSENHPKAFRMFPMCFTTMSECSPRIPRRLSEFSRHLSVEQYQRFWSFVCMFFYH